MSTRSRMHPPRMTEEEYLRVEATSRVRHEYVDGYVFAMSGATAAHNLICTNLLYVIYGHLGDGPCRAYVNDMKVKIESVRSYYYPDIMVSCEEFEAKSVFETSPVLLIEILSPSTAQIDRREKLIAYGKIESLKEYVIIYQDRQQVEVYRKEKSESWGLIELNVNDDLVLTSLPHGDLTIPFGTIYRGYNPPGLVKEEEGTYATT